MNHPGVIHAGAKAKLAHFRGRGRVWAVGAIHGARSSLGALHDILAHRLQPRDGLVYLGNYVGYGPQSAQVIDELMAFRRYFLSRPGIEPEDILHLRGAQEEIWRKMAELHFAHKPDNLLAWAEARGLQPTLASYGLDMREAYHAARESVAALGRWTAELRAALRRHEGHEAFFKALCHAALYPGPGNLPCPCEEGGELCDTAGGGVLFVHAGLNPDMALGAQNDRFWWINYAVETMQRPYRNFALVVRGHDRGHAYGRGPFGYCLDGGCGFGGSLIAACWDAQGGLCDRIEIPSS